MSRQASILERAGYITIRNGQVGQLGPHLAETHPAGRRAFNDDLTTLREVVETPDRHLS